MGKTAKRLGQTIVGDGASHAIYTVGTGKKAYVTSIHFANSGSSGEACYASIDNGVNSFVIAPNTICLQNDVLDFECSPGYILSAGESIDVASGTHTSCIVDGYEEIV